MGHAGQQRYQLGHHGGRVIISTLEHPEQHRLWPGIKDLLATAAARNQGRVWADCDLVWMAIENRQIVAVLTACLDGAGNIEIVNAGGHRAADWVRLMDEKLTEWAGAAGARVMTCRGRKGWGRLSVGLGWNEIGRVGTDVLYEKVL